MVKLREMSEGPSKILRKALLEAGSEALKWADLWVPSVRRYSTGWGYNIIAKERLCIGAMLMAYSRQWQDPKGKTCRAR